MERFSMSADEFRQTITTLVEKRVEHEREQLRQERDTQAVRHERAFRRGYHHGVVAAFDLVFSLLHTGMTVEDVNQLCSSYENEQVIPWREFRTEQDIPPVFMLTRYEQTLAVESDTETKGDVA